MTDDKLFPEIDLDILDCFEPADTDPLETDRMPSPRQLRRQRKARLLRIRQMQALEKVVCDPPAPGESLHVLSAAKWDFGRWIPKLVEWAGGTLDVLYVSTWVTSREHTGEMLELMAAGKIKTVGFLTGLYFKRRDTAIYTHLLRGLRKYGGRYRAYKNHAKLLLAANAAAGNWFTIEGSANLTANPRMEQYVISNDRDLYEFHAALFEEMLETIPADYDITE